MNERRTLFSPLFKFVHRYNFYKLNSLPELPVFLLTHLSKKKQKTIKPLRVLKKTGKTSHMATGDQKLLKKLNSTQTPFFPSTLKLELKNIMSRNHALFRSTSSLGVTNEITTPISL